ncbi:MAG: PAS domain S-box protein, partial [Bacteroides sp.]|nr:PAS domain S-box protein [Bacteroides sp.]
MAALLEDGTGKALIDEIRKKLDRFIEIEEELTIRRYDHATQTSVKTRNIAVILLVLALCFGVTIAVVTSRAISNPLAKLARGAKRIGRGDLDMRVDIESSDEIGDLSRAFNNMTRSLKEASFMRDQSEAALLESKENLSITLNSIGDAVITTDAEGRVTRMNPIAEKLTGWSLSNAEGHPLGKVFNIINEETRKKAENPVEKVIREGAIVALANHTILISKDGPEFPIDDSGAPIRNAKGDIEGVVLVFRDISEKKEAENALRESEEHLQQFQKMESIGTLAGGIAHDFNNILFPIVGNTEMLLEDIPEDSLLRGNLNEIFNGAMRAKELVRQILAFSRQDSNEIKLMRMQPIIKEALKLIRATIPTSIEIKQYISNDCGAIKADPTKIHQIVMNLATNAYHAMEDAGGELKVNLKEVELGEQDLPSPDMEPGPYACLIVADSGTGIDDNVRERIFDPYFTTKEQGKGTGMGLAVVHGIVKRAGGSIHLYSKPGQ